MEPKVECTEDSMKLQVQDAASTPGSLFFVDRGSRLSPLPLSKLPPSCGYSIRSTRRDLVLIAPYDGCFVALEAPIRLKCHPYSKPLHRHQRAKHNKPLAHCNLRHLNPKCLQICHPANHQKAKGHHILKPLRVRSTSTSILCTLSQIHLKISQLHSQLLSNNHHSLKPLGAKCITFTPTTSSTPSQNLKISQLRSQCINPLTHSHPRYQVLDQMVLKLPLKGQSQVNSLQVSNLQMARDITLLTRSTHNSPSSLSL
ncbi:protein piccolo-like protein [Lates japonicus]|uniref:Protein piccolo-like protein n=1 Tax=Lates japonicus TaxID=270547 RepID=A0AAD3R0M6_LATJO|nr:protein piccolo-like protein [Lates japonicus]